MKSLKIFFFAIILLMLSFTQERTKIYWHKRNIITWNDFKPVNFILNNRGAITSTGIIKNYISYGNKEITYDIKAYFNKDESIFIKSLASNFALKHEQNHFNISEIFARRIRKKLINNIYNITTAKDKINNIVSNLYNKSEMYQNEYDKQTNYSKNIDKQEEWNNIIAKELELLEDYKDIRVVCKVE